jgi:hypothetical protein
MNKCIIFECSIWRVSPPLASYHESEVALFGDLIGLNFDALHLRRDAGKALARGQDY